MESKSDRDGKLSRCMADENPDTYSIYDFIRNTGMAPEEKSAIESREQKDNDLPLETQFTFVCCKDEATWKQMDNKSLSHETDAKRNEYKENRETNNSGDFTPGLKLSSSNNILSCLKRMLINAGWLQKKSAAGRFNLVLGGKNGSGIPFARLSQLFQYDYGIKPLCNYYRNSHLLQNEPYLYNLVRDKPFLMPAFWFLPNDEEANSENFMQIQQVIEHASKRNSEINSEAQKLEFKEFNRRNVMRKRYWASLSELTKLKKKLLFPECATVVKIGTPYQLGQSKTMPCLSYLVLLTHEYKLYMLTKPINGDTSAVDLDAATKAAEEIAVSVFHAIKNDLEIRDDNGFECFQLFSIYVNVVREESFKLMKIEGNPRVPADICGPVAKLIFKKVLILTFGLDLEVSGLNEVATMSYQRIM